MTHYRQAQLRDCGEITSLVTRAVMDDGFHDYFFPGRHEYPHDFYGWWYRRIRDHILGPYNMVHVGIEDGSDRIVGLAMWMLFTLKPEERPEPMGVDLAKNSVVEVAQRHYFTAQDKVVDTLRRNRAVSAENMAEWNIVVQNMIKEYWSGDDRVHWNLVDFSFDPLWEPAPGKKEELRDSLIQWGIDQSNKDRIVTVVEGLDRKPELDIFASYGFELFPKKWVVGDGPSACWVLRRPLDSAKE